MKIKYTSIVQVIVLLLTVAAGTKLKSDLTDGPRLLHRSLGMLSGIAALATLYAAFKASLSPLIKTLAVTAVALVAVAGGAGSMLKSSSHYTATFATMRFGGVLALSVSVVLLVVVVRSSQTKPKV